MIKGHSIEEWIDVYSDIPVPLLSYRACRDLALIPEWFPAPVAQVTLTAVRSGDTMTVDETKEAPEITASKDVSVPHASLPYLPFNSNTTPEQARSYILLGRVC